MAEKDDPQVVGTIEVRFAIKSFWIDVMTSGSNEANVPSMVLSSTPERTGTPAAIVEFYAKSENIRKPSWDSKAGLIYLYYNVSIIETVIGLLVSGSALQVYFKSQTKDNVWGGINLIDSVP